ncbi:MAG: cysteine desulfurase, cysteine desulfurase [Parcubacteria group bacterium GW2011_GWC1_45_14]|nr:MAG: cysteine desulfurase, cysteine desulfurase [Parcubacteria group bacterium GW2011_GWC1_45_14]
MRDAHNYGFSLRSKIIMARIYLDYAATTPVDKSVLDAMLPYFSKNFGNPMSVHSFGQETLEAIDDAREEVAKFLSSSPTEIVFTSGATEANNLAIKGVLRSFYSIVRKENEKPHIITTSIEHHCVLDSCKAAQKDGLAEVTFLPVHKDGIVRLDDLKKAIKPNTIFVSVMYVSNEIGTVQPISEIGKLLSKINSEREEAKLPKILFHTDATQATNYWDCDVTGLGVDLLSFSGHKIYAPKGTGVLYIKKGTAIKRILDGGDQEYKMRGGTHNLTGIVGLGAAVSTLNDAKSKEKVRRQIEKLRDHLIAKILKEIPKSYLNGSKEKRTPNIVNFRFDDVEGEGLLLSLDLEGIAVSTGSACSSGALDPSHVLLALGLRHEQAHGSLRVSIGKHTTKQEVDIFIKKLKETVARLRRISGNVMADFK